MGCTPPPPADHVPDAERRLTLLHFLSFSAQYPACGDTQAAVTEDIQLISQLTDRIRLYGKRPSSSSACFKAVFHTVFFPLSLSKGADCNMSQLVLQAIQETKTNMTVFLAVYVDDNSTTYQRQVDEVQKAIQAYGVDHVS